jgi:hypothetical protein
MAQLLYPQERIPVPTEQETRWAPKPVWTIWRREKSLSAARIQTLHAAHRLVNTPTTLSWLPLCVTIYLFIHLFIYLFIHLFICFFTHSFIHSLIQCPTIRTSTATIRKERQWWVKYFLSEAIVCHCFMTSSHIHHASQHRAREAISTKMQI